MGVVVSGQLMLPDGARGVKIAPGSLVIRDGRIASVELGLHGSPDFGGPQHLITPGFVDTHVHLPQFDCIGVDGLELLDWLQRVIFPAEMRWADAGFAGAMAGRVAKELLGVGTTSVAAYATSHHEGTRAAMAALADAGMGGYVGQVLMDRGAPAELCVPAREGLASAAKLESIGRIAPAVTPRFAVACSEEMLRGAGELARKTGWLMQTHLCETRREIELVAELFGGARYLDVYEAAGLLGARSVFGHGIWLDDSDRAKLARAGAVVAHCPAANRFLEAGEMDRAAALGAGVRVSLGTDVAAGPDRSMVRVARGMMETAKQVARARDGKGREGSAHRAEARCHASEAWWQITAGNAAAIGLTDTGVLAPGMWGDVVVIKPGRTPGGATWLGSADPLAAVLWGWDDRWIEAVFAGGTPARTD
jgi:guanine deaminase